MDRKMKSMDWWYLDKKQRLFMSIGHSATHIKKGEGDFFIRRWYHKIDHKRIFISKREQEKMKLKRITIKRARDLIKLNNSTASFVQKTQEDKNGN